MFRSLFSLLNWSHLRETFGLICILIRPILITSQKKRLFNWAPPGFFSKHVLIYPTGNTHTSTSKSCSWHPIFLTFFTMKLLESYLHIHFHFLDPICSSVLSNLTFIFTSLLKLPSHFCSQMERFHLHLTSWVTVTFSTWLLCNKPLFSLSLGFSDDRDSHTHTLYLYTQEFLRLRLILFYLLYTFLLVYHSFHGISVGFNPQAQGLQIYVSLPDCSPELQVIPSNCLSRLFTWEISQASQI